MSRIWVSTVLLLLVVSSLGLLAVVSPGLGALGSANRASGAQLAQAPPTHGDLVVGAGQTYIIQPNVAGPTYYQGGNITVETGGTLDVWNVTLAFVEFVGITGTPEQRISHVYTFQDAGTVNFLNANLTTDVQVLNAYAKLNLTVTGTLNAWGSTFAFPGWIYVAGAGADMTLNQSTITWNANIAPLNEPTIIYGDTLYAPTITVAGGGNLTLLASKILHPYADDTAAWGIARPPTLFYSSPTGIAVGPGTTDIPVSGTGDAANLTQAYLYPTAGALNGYVSLTYASAISGDTTVDVSVTYGTTSYSLATGVVLPADSAGTLTYPFPGALNAAITAGGMLQYLNYTGAFGVPGSVSVNVDNTAGPASTFYYASFLWNTTGVSYNDYVLHGEVSAINSQLGFNWNQYNSTAGSQYSQGQPYPWNSNKWMFADHSTGYLVNVTTPDAPLPGVFGPSAFVPDASSQLNFYRVGQFNLTGRGGIIPIQGATVSAFYSLDQSQANNNTTTKLNHIAATDPAIWGYIQYWDAFHGVLAYGHSNAAGQGFLFLASSNLTAATLPDGIFLGAYHVGISVPAVGVAPDWFQFAVSPYPTGVASQSANYNGPDFAKPQVFPDYFGAASISSVTVLANGVKSTEIDIGQTLGVQVVVNDSGTATITQMLAALYYNTTLNSKSLIAEYENTTLDLTAPGQQTTFTLSWLVVEKLTGNDNGWFKHNLTLVLQWNYNISSLAGGFANQTVPVTFAPSMIRITSYTPPPNTLDLTTQPYYFSNGTITYNGSGAAILYLYATPTGGGSPILIAENSTAPGPFELPLLALQGVLSPGTSYTLVVTAEYNHREFNYTVPGVFTVPKSPSSPASFLFQTFLGLPLWLWLVIAAVAVVAIVLFLLFARRQAAGKLVECGECGNLIPEDATVCPKCGAEFESDLIRCSRCASTIPANSKFCPECAAQLLGKPGEAEADPEKQAYADFTEKYRAEAKRELGDNYTEGAFWDWWKRQPTYTPFSQWSLQQGQGTARAGMTAPPAGTEVKDETSAGTTPPKGGAGGGWTEASGAPAAAAVPKATTTPPTTTTVPPPAAGGAGLKACPSCGKEIPAEYLVCPFCNAVTQ
jgi:RNA polymerase subunit RPABC4/transcription elongation factor Spt4